MRHTIWSNAYLDLEDWRDDLEEEYPGASEEELYERVNLDHQFNRPILVIANLGHWNGRSTGYKEIQSGNIRDCLYPDTDITTWYVDDEDKEFRCKAEHHDGTNHYLYRVYKESATTDEVDELLDAIYCGKLTDELLDAVTEKIGDTILNIYWGWNN